MIEQNTRVVVIPEWMKVKREAALAFLGNKWILHPDNKTCRKDKR